MRAEPPPPQSTDPHLHTSIQLLPQDPCRALWEHLRRLLVSLSPPYWTFITLAWPAEPPGSQVNRPTHLTVSSACCCMVEDCRSLWAKTNRLKHSFLHQAVRMLYPHPPAPAHLQYLYCLWVLLLLFITLLHKFNLCYVWNWTANPSIKLILMTLRLQQKSGKCLLAAACQRRSWFLEAIILNLIHSLLQSVIIKQLWQDGKQRY